MKKRFGNVPGFNIEKIGRETLGPGTGIYKLSGLQEQGLIDYYTSDKVSPGTRQGRYKSLVGMLAQDMAVEQFQEMKTDKDFMNDLSFKLKEAGIELTADEFIDQVESKLDKRTKEKRSLDIVETAESKIDKFITTKLDPLIDQYKETMGSGPTPGSFAQAFKTALQAYQKAIKAGKTFAEGLQKFINSIANSFKLTSQQKATFEKEAKDKIKTEAQLSNENSLFEIMQTSGIDVIAKDIEGDVTVTSKNRKARQESLLNSITKVKMPGALFNKLGLANFGRKRVYGDVNNKYTTRKVAKKAGIKKSNRIFSSKKW